MTKSFEDSVIDVAASLPEQDVKRIVAEHAIRRRLPVVDVLRSWLREHERPKPAVQRRKDQKVPTYGEQVEKYPEATFTYGMGAPSIEPAVPKSERTGWPTKE